MLRYLRVPSVGKGIRYHMITHTGEKIISVMYAAHHLPTLRTFTPLHLMTPFSPFTKFTTLTNLTTPTTFTQLAHFTQFGQFSHLTQLTQFIQTTHFKHIFSIYPIYPFYPFNLFLLLMGAHTEVARCGGYGSAPAHGVPARGVPYVQSSW